MNPEIALGIVVADSLHNLLQGGLDGGILSLLYPLADQIAGDPAEVVVPCIREERSGVGQHAHEIA